MLKVGIICAGDSELAPFLPHIERVKTTQKAMLRLYEGTIGSVRAVALFSGVCKVNAAIAAQLLIDRFGVNLIVNAGTCGGMDDGLEVFTTVIATESAYHDVDGDILTDFHPWMETAAFASDATLLALATKAVQAAGLAGRVAFGRMVTGEAFITEGARARINERFRPLSVDMETAAIAHVCYVNSIPFIAIRTVTDTSAHGGREAEYFEKNCAQCAAIAKDVTLLLLRELGKR